jgi:serine/threonine protein kinase
MTGEKILNYKIENLTEENSLFRSFLATHTQFAKKVIVKTLKTGPSPEEKNELVQDIRRLSLIQHPNVITLYDLYESNQELYLVFEYIPGKTLADYIRSVSGPIPEAKTRQYFLQILDAFAWAHHRGVMNGAISANHIILNTDEQIKVLDLALNRFFAYKSLAEGNKDLLNYASPELIEGKPLNQRADVYGLGVLLFQMLTGKLPYEGFNTGEIRYKIVNEPLPTPTDFYPMVSEEMQNIIQKATAKNPNDRYQTCEDFRQALLEIKEFTYSKQSIQTAKEQAIAQQKANEPKIEAKFLNLPLYLFFGFSVITLLIVLWNFLSIREYDSEVLFDIKNTQRIKSLQDSIAQAQEKKALEDSLRRFQDKTKNLVAIHYHRVNRGENLDRIARRYLVPLDSVKKWNGLTGREKLKPKDGIKVKIKQIYKVQRNETLEQIALKFNISPFVLKEVNQLYPKPPKQGEEPIPVFFEGKDLVIPLTMNNTTSK